MRHWSMTFLGVLLLINPLLAMVENSGVAYVEFVEQGGYVLHYLGLHKVARVKVTDANGRPVPFVKVTFLSADTQLVNFIYLVTVTDTNGIAATLIQSQISTETILFPPPEFRSRTPAITAIVDSIKSREVPVSFLWGVFVDPFFMGPFLDRGSNSFIDIAVIAGNKLLLTGHLFRALGELPPSGTRFVTYSTDSRIVRADTAVSDSDEVKIPINPLVPGLAHIIVDGIPPAAIGVHVLPSTAVAEQEQTLSAIFTLEQNYPNPANPSTIIRYILPKASHVVLKVYNFSGQEITTLVNGEQRAGAHQIMWNPKDLASGVYLYSLQAGDFVQTKKLTLLK